MASAPADINSQIVYPAAVVQASKNPAVAQDYLNFLFSDQAKALFVKYGFTMATN
jgi:molybdate transport system substrate-binding protein